jgi:hypothetical protein
MARLTPNRRQRRAPRSRTSSTAVDALEIAQLQGASRPPGNVVIRSVRGW